MADESPQSKVSIPRTSFEDAGNTKESRVFVGAPDYRVFIWGIEVTSDVFAVSTTLSMNDNVSTAMINLVNDNEKWVLPTGYAASSIDAIPDELSETTLETSTDIGALLSLSPGSHTKDPSRRYVTPAKFARLKRRNLLRKLQAEDSGQQSAASIVIDRIQSSNLFPFLPGRPLIQMTDPIRVFFKNPWKFDGEEEWYFAFTGYIASVTEDFDAQTNRSILRIGCEDIRRLLRYMRTSTNPNVFNMNVLQQDNAPIIAGDAQELQKKLTTRASDLVLVTGNNAISAGMVLVQRGGANEPPGVMELLLFGDTDQLGINQGNRGDSALDVSGVLGFKQGGKEVIQLPVDDNFEASLSSTLDQIYPILTPTDVANFGVDWSLGDVNLNPAAPAPNKLWVIMPDRNHFPDLRDPFGWDMRIDFFSEFRSRLDIINEFVKNIDCIWYATPKGDIVLEFPNYDCHPHLHADPWKSILTLQNEFTRFSSTEDDRNIKTLTIAVGSALDGVPTNGLPFLAYEPFRNPELIARYGIREQRSNRPFHYKNKNITNALPALAAMWQELANADAYRLEGLEMLPNFRAVPGRPYHFKFRNMIAFAETIQHQIVWNELAQTVYGLKYVRHFDAVQKDWQKLSGNYGWHWKPVKSSVADDSVNAISRGPNFVQGRRTASTVPDPSVSMMEQRHQEIIQYEKATGQPALTPGQHEQLDSITAQLKNPLVPPTPTERQTLINQYNQILGQVGLTL
jgi:hypothetical protein